MSSEPANVTKAAFEIKGRMTTLSLLRILVTEPDTLHDQLASRAKDAPAMFYQLPIIIDLDAVADVSSLKALVDRVLAQKLNVLGIKASDIPAVREVAVQTGLPLVPATGPETGNRPSGRKGDAPPTGAAKVITQVVRSGQQVYARGGDLVVLAAVSPGAEVLADGHIHVYGPLRGRALAGVQGDVNARIFCDQLEAELVSVAGHYQVSEHLDESVRGRRVQIYLRDEQLCMESL